MRMFNVKFMEKWWLVDTKDGVPVNEIFQLMSCFVYKIRCVYTFPVVIVWIKICIKTVMF